MNILHIAYYTFKRTIIGKKAMISMIAAPLLFILILGASLNSLFDYINFENVKIYVYSENTSTFNEFKNYTENQKLKANLSVKRITSRDVGISEVKKENVAALICLGIENNKKIIKVYVYREDSFSASMIGNLVVGYKNSFESKTNSNYLIGKGIDNVGKSPRAIDYYAVTMLIMMILYYSEECIAVLNEDLFRDVKDRVNSLPLKAMDNVIGKILGFTFSTFVCAMIIILFSKSIYGVNWGNDLGYVTLVILLFSFFSANLGSAIFFITKNIDISNYIIQAMVPAFTFLSGGYFQTDFFSEGLEKMANLSPSYAVQNMIFNNIYRGYCSNISVYYLEAAVLLSLTLILVFTFGRRIVK